MKTKGQMIMDNPHKNMTCSLRAGFCPNFFLQNLFFNYVRLIFSGPSHPYFAICLKNVEKFENCLILAFRKVDHHFLFNQMEMFLAFLVLQCFPFWKETFLNCCMKCQQFKNTSSKVNLSFYHFTQRTNLLFILKCHQCLFNQTWRHKWNLDL